MRHWSYLLLGAALLGLSPFTVFGQDKKDQGKDKGKDQKDTCQLEVPSFKHLDGRTIVFVANGVNSSTRVSDHLIDLNSDQQLGLHVRMVGWCRKNAIFQDMADQDAQLQAAYRLACWTTAIRKDAPKAKILFIGHSAGARIVVAAAEMGGPNCVDRVVLLHAAIASTYDLHNALKGSRNGIDSFHSEGDGILEHAEEHAIFPEGPMARAAGRVGFVAPSDKEGAQAYKNLRQYPWRDELFGGGGHFGWTHRHNMRKVLVPILFGSVHGGYAGAVCQKLPDVKK